MRAARVSPVEVHSLDVHLLLVDCMHDACVPHVRCMAGRTLDLVLCYDARLLHLCCMCIACMVHVCCTDGAHVLHASCIGRIGAACMSHACDMRIAGQVARSISSDEVLIPPRFIVSSVRPSAAITI